MLKRFQKGVRNAKLFGYTAQKSSILGVFFYDQVYSRQNINLLDLNNTLTNKGRHHITVDWEIVLGTS